MTGEPTGRARRLQQQLSANAQRLERREVAEVTAKVGGAVAAACDRFTLHRGDPALRHVEAWIRRNGDGYSGRKPDAVVSVAWTDLVDQVRELVRRHELEGWCILFRHCAPDRDGFGWGIGLDVSQVHALTDLLFSSDDVFFASEAHRWCVNIHHEGELWLWRDVDWGKPDVVR